MQSWINYNDTSLDLIRHNPSGELYVAQYASVWSDQRCEGSTIIRIYGPVYYRGQETETAESAAYLLGNHSSTEDVDWANEQMWKHERTLS